MFILPYFIKEKTSSSGYRIRNISFFLENGGTQLIQIDGNVEEFCKENDLNIKSVKKHKSIYFVNICEEKTNMKGFYSFHEKVAEGLEVWRNFLWVDEEGKDIWNVNGKLKDISISGYTVFDLITTI